MKKIVYLISFLSVFSSCEKIGVFEPDPETEVTFKVNFDEKSFFTQNVSFTSNGTDIVMSATKQETDEVFTIRISNYGLGSFNFIGANNIGTYVKNNSTSADTWSTANVGAIATIKGSIEFTEIDNINNTVSGTFLFRAKNSSNNNEKDFIVGSFTNVPKSGLTASDNTFTAKLNGVEFNEISLFGNSATVGSKQLILINANKSLTETIGFSLESDISVGEYDFGSSTAQTYPTGKYVLNDDTYVADGKINITEHNVTTKFISGTFEFDASLAATSTPNFEITEGAFSISY